ncbi:unnamed protein product [Closterium sp. NIES-64]|nr:unnamed protein product [Closterium sp. NIES-64]
MRLNLLGPMLKVSLEGKLLRVTHACDRWACDVSVRRHLLAEDALVRLNQLWPVVKGRVRVSFVNAFGAEEIGMDQGGLFKEFLTDLAKAAFDPGYVALGAATEEGYLYPHPAAAALGHSIPMVEFLGRIVLEFSYGLFLQAATEEGYLYPHPAAAALGHGIPMVEFLGRIVGKALYEGILLEYNFAPLFVSKLVGRYAFLDELSSLDMELYRNLMYLKVVGRYAFLHELSALDVELYRNLMYLKHYEGDASELALDFTVTEEVLGEYNFVGLRRAPNLCLPVPLSPSFLFSFPMQHYEGDASELALDFTVTEEVLGEHNIVELRPGGSHIAVTNHYEGDASELSLDFTVTEEVLVGRAQYCGAAAGRQSHRGDQCTIPFPLPPCLFPQHYEGDASELALDFTVTEEVLREHNIVELRPSTLVYSPSVLPLPCLHLAIPQHYEGDASELALDFTVTEEVLGEHNIVELRPGGSHIAVTNENKLQYIHAVADYKLNRQMAAVVAAFLRGLSDLIQPEWLRLFSPKEFNQLLSGGEQDVDVEDLKAHTRYSGGYTESDRTIRMFWEVVKELSREEKSQLLKFVTSCSRPPLLGFKHLNPPLTIHKVNVDASMWATLGGPDVDWLPTASTCYNLLKVIIAPAVLQPAQGNHCSCCATACSR